MADGYEISSSESNPNHKYMTTCDSFIEDVENGFITNSIQNVLTESEQDQCSSENASISDDLKYENIERYTHFEPQEGRPILNTSMIRFTNQTKGRSPLTVVSNQNAVQYTAQKKNLPTISTDETFFYYQRKVPQTGTGIDHFARLSYEMILSIFQWLPKKALLRCSLVSKRFNTAATDETLWGRLDLAGRNLNVGALGRILRRGVVVIRLSQTKVSKFCWHNFYRNACRSWFIGFDCFMSCFINFPLGPLNSRKSWPVHRICMGCESVHWKLYIAYGTTFLVVFH